MAIDGMQSSNGHAADGASFDRETLLLFSGVAMLVFGAGLVLSSPSVRRFIGHMGVGNLTGDILPDLERYLKLRNM